MKRVEEENLLRELAAQFAEIAAGEAMHARIERWKTLVSGGRPDRIPVLCRVNCSEREIFPPGSYLCRDPFLLAAEKYLRWGIFTATLGDDHCVFPYFPSPAVIELANPPLFGVEPKKERTGEVKGAWKTVPVIREERDLNRLRLPEWRHNPEATAQNAARLRDIFGGLLEVRITGGSKAHTIYDQTAETLLGYNELLLDVALKPRMIHRLMAFLRDHALASVEQIEAMGILTANNDYHKYNSRSIKADKSTPVGHRDLWIWSNSQIFGAVGPEHFNEFLLEYQKPVFEHFGAVSYGCCEDLTRKLQYIRRIPNLRTFVCSSWTDLAAIAPICAEDDLCIEWRQLATDMMGAPDFDRWERHLRQGLEITADQRRYIVLQEVETIEGDIGKFRRWCDLAVRIAAEMTGA